jgi:hypothetical protein
MADIAALNMVLTVCGLRSQQQRDAVIGQGFTMLRDFGELDKGDIESMVKRINDDKTPAVRPRAGAAAVAPPRIGAIPSNRLCALNFWVCDMIHRGLPLDHNEFTDQVCLTSIEQMNGYKRSSEDEETSLTLE